MAGLRALALAACLWSGAVGGAPGEPAPDAIGLPPETRRFASPSKSHVLDVVAIDGWRTPRASARLWRTVGAGRTSRWQADLPQRYGPGLALVTDEGVAVLFDEWLRVPGDLAVVVIGPDGVERFRRSVRDLAAAAGVPASDLVRHASVGPWMAAPPVLSDAQDRVRLEAGGRSLLLHLDTGAVDRAGPAAR